MSGVVFARPRWEYDSYRDFWRLVELSGYPIIYLDEMDVESDRCYIFSTPSTDWYHGWQNPRARLIYYNIEYYLDINYASIPGVEVWSADKWFARRNGSRYVPMGSHRELNCHPDDLKTDKVYDIVTLWAASSRRYTAIDLLQQQGLKVAPNGWGEDRHRILSQSRAMYIVHQRDDAPAVAPQRWALAAAYHLPVITEQLADSGLFGSRYRLSEKFINLAGLAATMLRPEVNGALQAYGEALYHLLCEERPFRRAVEAAL